MQSVGQQHHRPTKKLFRILSIDGGGVRGVIPAGILEYIEKRLQERDPHSRISEYFDMVVGTSAGGLITALLLVPGSDGKPKYSAKDAREMYEDKVCKVFTDTYWSWIKTGLGWTGPKYDPTPFEKLLKDYCGDIKLSDLIRPCLITAYDIERSKAHFFTNMPKVWHTKDILDFYIRDVIRCTTAAPTYFPPAKAITLGRVCRKHTPTDAHCRDKTARQTVVPIALSETDRTSSTDFVWLNVSDSKKPEAASSTPPLPANQQPVVHPDSTEFNLIDGGVFANNPALCGYAEARSIQWNGFSRPTAADMFILSLSCGMQKDVYKGSEASRWGKLQWASPLINILLDGLSTTVDYELAQIFDAVGKPEQYVRFDPPLKKASNELDNATPKNIQLLKEDLDTFMSAPETKKKLDDIVDLLWSERKTEIGGN